MKELPPTGLDLTDNTPEDLVIPDLTDEEVKSFALKIIKNEIFTSDHIRPGDEHLLPNVFMTLMFMPDEHRQQLIDQKVTMFYADMKHAAPMGVNGYPILFSVGFIKQPDHQRVLDKYKQIRDTLDGL